MNIRLKTLHLHQAVATVDGTDPSTTTFDYPCPAVSFPLPSTFPCSNKKKYHHKPSRSTLTLPSTSTNSHPPTHPNTPGQAASPSPPAPAKQHRSPRAPSPTGKKSPGAQAASKTRAVQFRPLRISAEAVEAVHRAGTLTQRLLPPLRRARALPRLRLQARRRRSRLFV